MFPRRGAGIWTRRNTRESCKNLTKPNPCHTHIGKPFLHLREVLTSVFNVFRSLLLGDTMLREKTRSHQGSSSETTSSSSSSQGFAVKVIQRPELPPAFPAETYEQERPPAGLQYPMECERGTHHSFVYRKLMSSRHTQFRVRIANSMVYSVFFLHSIASSVVTGHQFSQLITCC